jgi:F-type H+-transporting ATPase subunit delta
MSSTAENSGFDIDRQQVGKVYARALLGATAKLDSTGAVLDEFQSLIRDVLDQMPGFDAVLASPRVTSDQKLAILDKAFAGRMREELLVFLKVVAGKGRLDCLRAMLRESLRLDNEARGVVEVRVSTAHAVTRDVQDSVSAALSSALSSEVEMQYNVLPGLIGGMVVRVGDRVFDGSVVNRLEQLRGHALQGTFQEMIGTLDRFTASEVL